MEEDNQHINDECRERLQEDSPQAENEKTSNPTSSSKKSSALLKFSAKSSYLLLILSSLLLLTELVHSLEYSVQTAARSNPHHYRKLRRRLRGKNAAARRSKNRVKSKQAITFDADKDALVDQIVKQQFGSDYKVVDGRNHRGQVSSIFNKQGSTDNFSHGDTYYVDHGKTANKKNDLNRLSSIKGRSKVISIGETIQDLAGGGQRLIEECLKIELTDIAFIIDGSWSVKPEGFEKVQEFLLKLIKNFDVGPQNTQFAAVQYSGAPRSEFTFNQIKNEKDLRRAVKKMQYMGGNTASGAALTYTLKNIFSKNGARDTAKQVAIIITDGESLQDKVTEPAKKMRKAGVEIFAIGVGSSYNRAELEDMATNPDDEHVFHVDRFDNILAIEREILRDVCQVTVICPSLTETPPTNGRVQCTKDPPVEGTSCKFYCHRGYEIKSGNKERICQNDAKWTGENPVCQKSNCKDLTAPHHASMACSQGFYLSSVCSFDCNPGYAMKGLERTRCSLSGDWTNPVPTCDRVRCPPLNKNGNTRLDCSDGNWFGSECNFNCNTGYRLVGQRLLRCVDDGRWDGSQPYCQLLTCGMLYAPLNGALVCSDKDSYGSECIYTCDKGFEILGSERATCTAQGRWIGGRPLCKRINCGPVPRPENARVICDEGNSLSLDGFGTICKIICQPGYRLAGSDAGAATVEIERECKADGSWSTPNGKFPICEKVRCTELDSPQDGRMTCTNAHFFESRCLFSCVPGYELVGARERICMDDGEWTGRVASCNLISCPPMRAPVRGNVTCVLHGQPLKLSHTIQFSSTANKVAQDRMIETSALFKELPFGTGCEFICDDGFQMIGSTDAVCRKDRAWSSEIPLCEPVSCTPIQEITDGTMECSDNFEHNSVCRFWCKPGHILEGSVARTCSLGRSWTGTPASCGPVLCGTLDRPRNGRMRCSDGDRFTSLCNFKCKSGYELVGTKDRSCMEDGKWSGTQPLCNLIHCGPLQQPASGFMRCSDHYNYNSLCRFSCQEGYELVGSDERECLITKHWSGEEPVCVLIQCVELKTPTNGKMKCTDSDKYGSTCIFSCQEGYDLSGSLRRQCTEAGTWSGVMTRCGAASCGALAAPKHGTIDCSENDLFGSVCKLGCKKGYELIGSVERVCQSNHVWSGVTSTCNLVQCDILIPPRDGEMNCNNGHLYDSACKFSCKEGYTLQGKKRTKCLDSKAWSNSIPTCEIKLCNDISAPPHSTMRCTDNNRYESQCTIFCKLGHEMNGFNEITCGSSSKWMAPAIDGYASYEVNGFPNDVCIKISCPELKVPENGVMQCSDDYNYDSLCRAQCDPGYDLLGSRARRCQWSGHWSGVDMVCHQISCPSFTLPDTIEITCKETDNNKVCRFAPTEGYRLVGSNKVICLPTGQWSDNFPVAELIECSNDIEILHGVADCSKGNKFGSKCEYKCRAGYELNGPPSRRCKADGAWNKQKPICVLGTCRPLAIPSNGRMYCLNGNAFGSECVFSCELGYELNNTASATRTCSEDGSWTGDMISCQRITCGKTEKIQNGTTVCSAQATYGSICSYSCDPGFDLRGTQQRVCQADHSWSGAKPTCQVIMCGPLSSPDKGSVKCENADIFGSECKFKCKKGYTLHGSTTRLCGAVGAWTGTQPVCELVTCPALNHPPSGRVSCTYDSDYDSTCKYTCSVGYNLQGAENRRCLGDGTWSGSQPFCELVKCGTMPKPKNGRIRCTDKDWFNSTCTYECNIGYRIKGEETRNCLETGLWTGGIDPTCVRVTCPELIPPPYGSILCSATQQFESRCRVDCGSCHKLVGSEERICRADGFWSGTDGVCQRSQCAPMLPPLNGYADCDHGDECGSKCTFRCKVGFRLNIQNGDRYQRGCQPNGAWSGHTPECVRETCPLLTPPGDVIMTCSNFNKIGSNCTFTCDEDSNLIGSQWRECTVTGSWSNTMPVCKQCSHIRSDLIFVIDGSWSVGEENFRLTKEFLKSLVLPFEIGYDYTRVAVVQYSDDPRVEFYLKTHLDKTELLNAIDSIPYKGGNTRTGDAIEFVMTNILDAKKGARPRVSKYCLLLTDGQSQDDVGNSARAIKNSGVKMFALGIGAARVDELKLIASPPFADTMYYETDYDAIKQLQEKLTNKFCEEVDSYGLYSYGQGQGDCSCPAGPPGPPGPPGVSFAGGMGNSAGSGMDDRVVVMQSPTSHPDMPQTPQALELMIRKVVLSVLKDQSVLHKFRGVKGNPGPTGLRGLPGPQGAEGRRGPQGPTGPRGKNRILVRNRSKSRNRNKNKDDSEVDDENDLISSSEHIGMKPALEVSAAMTEEDAVRLILGEDRAAGVTRRGRRKMGRGRRLRTKYVPSN